MDLLKSLPSTVAAGTIAAGVGVGILQWDVRSVTYSSFLMLTCVLPALKFAQKQTLWFVSLGITMTVLLWDIFYVDIMGPAGRQIAVMFSLLAGIIAGSWVYEFKLKDRPVSDDWGPLRPAAVTGMQLENMKNKLISDRLKKDMQVVVDKKLKLMSRRKICQSELVKVCCIYVPGLPRT